MLNEEVASRRSGLDRAPPAASPPKVFWTTWLGWMLDGFDGGIHIFVLMAPETAGKPLPA